MAVNLPTLVSLGAVLGITLQYEGPGLATVKGPGDIVDSFDYNNRHDLNEVLRNHLQTVVVDQIQYGQ